MDYPHCSTRRERWARRARGRALHVVLAHGPADRGDQHRRFAALMSIEDDAPVLASVASAPNASGFAIAYAVNVASPWERTRPILRRLHRGGRHRDDRGIALVILIKGYIIESAGLHARRAASGSRHSSSGTADQRPSSIGLFVSLFFLLKFRETRARAALHRPKPNGTSCRSRRSNRS